MPRPTRPPAPRRRAPDPRPILRAAAAALLLAGAPAAPAGAQDSGPAVSPALDTASLASGPYASMHTLLEKTLFQVDVLTLDLRFGRETAGALERIASAGSSDDAADSAAAAALRSRNALARLRFLRGVSLDQFLDATRTSMRKAVEAGVLADTAYRAVSERLPDWFSFLEERGIREGDVLLYRIRGDTLRTLFIARSGEVLLDHRDVGAERRRAVLGGYLAPDTDFREGLLRSLFREAGAAGRSAPRRPVSATRAARSRGPATGRGATAAAGT